MLEFPVKARFSSLMTSEETIWGELGEKGFANLVSAFYQRVRKDDLIGPMYPDDDWDGSEERLRDFLCFRFGAVMRYQEKRGHPRLRMRHMPYRIGIKERDRWMELMGGALDETVTHEEVREALRSFFAGVADFMRNRPEAER